MNRQFEYYKDLFGKSFTITVLLAGATVSSLKAEGINFWNVLGTILCIAGGIFTYRLNAKYKGLAEEKDD